MTSEVSQATGSAEEERRKRRARRGGYAASRPLRAQQPPEAGCGGERCAVRSDDAGPGVRGGASPRRTWAGHCAGGPHRRAGRVRGSDARGPDRLADPAYAAEQERVAPGSGAVFGVRHPLMSAIARQVRPALRESPHRARSGWPNALPPKRSESSSSSATNLWRARCPMIPKGPGS